MHAIAFRVMRIVFWAALAVHLGAIIGVGATAPAVFNTLKIHNPQVQPASNPLNWERQLGAEVFGNVLSNLRLIEFSAVAVMATALIAESFLLRGAMLRKISHWIRIGLVVCLAGLLAYDAAILSPQVHAKRAEWRDSGVLDGPHRAEFDVLHKRATALGYTRIYFLLGLLAITVIASTAVPPALPKKIKPVEPEPVGAGKPVA